MENVNQVEKLIKLIDDVLINEAAMMSDAINAVSIISTSLAIKLNLDKESYLKDIGIMYDERKE
jgi:hypothetical protein